jgi:hypothetical protein
MPKPVPAGPHRMTIGEDSLFSLKTHTFFGLSANPVLLGFLRCGYGSVLDRFGDLENSRIPKFLKLCRSLKTHSRIPRYHTDFGGAKLMIPEGAPSLQESPQVAHGLWDSGGARSHTGGTLVWAALQKGRSFVRPHVPRQKLTDSRSAYKW